MTSAKRTDSSDESDGDTLEGTLALIKPDAVHKTKEILQRISDEGFLVVEKQRMNFSRYIIILFIIDWSFNVSCKGIPLI